MPVMFGVDKILTGEMTAVLVPATNRDGFRRSEDDTWHAIDELEIGDSVHEVYHFGQSGADTYTAAGKVVTIKEIGNKLLHAKVMITDIHLVRANELTESEKDELGRFKLSERIGVNLIQEMGNRRGWFLRIIMVNDTSL